MTVGPPEARLDAAVRETQSSETAGARQRVFMATVKSPRFREVLAAAAIGLAVAALLFYPMLVSGRVGAFGDNVSFWAPNTAFWMGEVTSGGFPLWNPYVLGGVPFAADINHGLYYPPHWLVLVIGIAEATTLLALLHLALGICGMYLLLKALGVPSGARTWGAIAFGLCEGFAPLVNHIVMLESMSYAPLIMYLAVRLTDGARLRTALSMGVLVALSALAGDVHATYITALGVGAIVVTRCVQRVVRGETFVAAKAVLFSGTSAAAAALLAAVALLPAMELARLTVRGAGAVEYASYNCLDPKAAVGMVMPGFWGSISDGTVWNARWNNNAYLGLAVIALALYGARRLSRGAAGIALVVVGAGLAFGAYSPLWRAAYAAVPGFNMFRQPREYFILAVIGVIILAAHGLGDLATGVRGAWSWRRFLVTFAVVGAAAGAAIGAYTLLYSGLEADARAGDLARIGEWAATSAWIRIVALQALLAGLVCGVAVILRRGGIVPPKAAAVVIGVAVLADYALLSQRALVFGPPELYESKAPAAVAATPSGEPEPRYVSEARGFGEYFEGFARRKQTGALKTEGPSRETLFKVKECLVDDEALYARATNVLGYSTFVTKRYAALYEAATGREASPVRLKAVEGANYALLGATNVIKAGDDWTYKGDAAIPGARGAWVAYSWRTAEGFDDALSQIKSGRQFALTSPVIEGAPQPDSSTAPVYDNIRNWKRSQSRLSLDVTAAARGMLVVAEANYPGWYAYLDGSPAPIYYANLAFRAIEVSAGKHTVEFYYRPVSVNLGAGITFVALLIVIVGLAIAPRGKRP